ncbi:MAG: hypothetical protein JF614_12985 [Acidobacteria bacterium]|nr:hypothetical protein [Acidobacteriota bacterium]
MRGKAQDPEKVILVELLRQAVERVAALVEEAQPPASYGLGDRRWSLWLQLGFPLRLPEPLELLHLGSVAGLQDRQGGPVPRLQLLAPEVVLVLRHRAADCNTMRGATQVSTLGGNRRNKSRAGA